MEAIQNKMRSRKEIKVEAASANPLIMKGYRRGHAPTTVHPVLELSPSVHKRFLEAENCISTSKVAVYDQSPGPVC
ncbi:hypothetical protein EVAR_85956_1 [Eumeta japonica]|uniref:Uncharacterized protein n=1 Tax=Eumeta variegata TaxID=151549 RepID=A0A4C1UKP0_EUMVA|nr:hypothetical protein EVAR_85956_1 [Eumeta japonica]